VRGWVQQGGNTVTVIELVQVVRNRVNEPRFHGKLQGKTKAYGQACSSMDMLGDSTMAIEAHGRMQAKDVGEQYLLLYGLLQAMFVEQDAALHLCKALDHPASLDDYEQLRQIRDIRNCSVGHPTEQGKEKERWFHFITQSSLSKDGFDLNSVNADGRRSARQVSIGQLLENQASGVSSILELLLKTLAEEEEAHHAKFRDKPLKPLIGGSLNYALEKLGEPTYGNGTKAQARWGLDAIQTALGEFQAALEERELGHLDSVTHALQKLEYPFKKLSDYLDSATEGVIDNDTAYIFVEFIGARLDELRTIVEGIDQCYAAGSAASGAAV